MRNDDENHVPADAVSMPLGDVPIGSRIRFRGGQRIWTKIQEHGLGAMSAWHPIKACTPGCQPQIMNLYGSNDRTLIVEVIG